MRSSISSSWQNFTRWWMRLRILTVKELLQLARDSILVLFIIFGFTADIYIAGSGVSLELKDAAVYFLDWDRSESSRSLIELFRPPYFRPMGYLDSGRQAGRLLDQGEAMLVMEIPPDFEELLARGRQAELQLQIDTTNTVLGLLASSYAERIVADFSLERSLDRIGMTDEDLRLIPRVQSEYRAWFNPNQNHSWFMSISELLNIITIFSILLPAAAMVREKERGTAEQLLVAPLSPFQIMFPKVLAMTGVILAGTAVSVFLVLRFLLDVPLVGSLFLFFVVTALYVFTTAGLGLFISTVASNLAQVGMITILVMAPMMFLSGVWTPPEAMPSWFRMGMLISPLHYYVDASYGILLKGAGLEILWDSILGITVIGTLLFAFGVWRYRRQFG